MIAGVAFTLATGPMVGYSDSGHLALRASRDNPLCRHKRQRLTRRYSLSDSVSAAPCKINVAPTLPAVSIFECPVRMRGAACLLLPSLNVHTLHEEPQAKR